MNTLDNRPQTTTRRSFLAVAGTVALVGCSSVLGSDGPDGGLHADGRGTPRVPGGPIGAP